MDYLSHQNEQLAYRLQRREGPTMVYLGGFRSDMSGAKARYFEFKAAQAGISSLCLDYSAHGASSGEFSEKSIRHWFEDALAVIQNCVTGPIILVGSSMGGWIMLLVARELGAQVQGLLGIASAPDFVDPLIVAKLPPEALQSLTDTGEWQAPAEHGSLRITQQFIDEGRDMQVLTQPLELKCPVRLVHGLADTDVPWEFSMRICQHIASTEVHVVLIKDGDHRLSQAHHLSVLAQEFDSLLAST